MDRYDLIRAITGGRFILSLKKGFEKDDIFYRNVEEQLSEDWKVKDKLVRRAKRKKIRVGRHVMVRLEAGVEGYRRGMVLDKIETCRKERQYSVFLYDHGLFVDVGSKNIALLREKRQGIPPRTVVVHLLGMVPAKVVMDVAQKMMGNENASYILKQDSEWSRKATNMVSSWLREEQVKYLVLDARVTRRDGSVYGDVYRVVAEGRSDDSNPSEGLGRKAPMESLCNWIITKNLGMENEDLKNSQLSHDVPIESPSDSESTNDANDASQGELQDVEKQQKTSAAAALLNDKRTLQDEISFDPVRDENQRINKSGSSDSSSSVYFDCENFDVPEPCSFTSADKRRETKLDKLCVDATSHNTQSDIPGHILVRGSIARRQYTKLEEFDVPEPLIKAMKRIRVADLSYMQRIVSANFIRANDMMLIAADNGPHGKKPRMFGYILPILKLVYERHVRQTYEDGANCSPEAIIVVNSFNTGKTCENFMLDLLSYCPQLPVRIKFLCKDIPDDKVCDRFFQNKLLPKGISILITTVKYLSKLLDTKHGSNLRDNLNFVIFEEVELYMMEYWATMTWFVECLRETVKREGVGRSFQVTFSSNKWSPDMNKLYKEVCTDERRPILVISALGQILRYAQVMLSMMHSVGPSDKLQKISDLCNVNQGHRIVIACSSSSVAQDVHDYLVTKISQTPNILTDDTTPGKRDYILEKLWTTDGTNNLLIISDEMLYDINVIDATCLIHFDSGKSKIAERFRYMWKNFRNITEMSGDERRPVKETLPLAAHFVMTGIEDSFYKLYNFATTSGLPLTITDELKERALQMEIEGDITTPFCRRTRDFGYCKLEDISLCEYRHYFTRKELMTEPVVPSSGEIEVRIKEGLNPSNYQVQLLRHFTYEDGKRICSVSYIDELHKRHELLRDHYQPHIAAQEGNRKGELTVDNWKIGSLCAIMHPVEKTFTRGRITATEGCNEYGEPQSVQVFCIDIGDNSHPHPNKVFKLPEEFQRWPRLTANLVLCNLKPPRDEVEYRKGKYSGTRAYQTSGNKVFHAKIWISVGNTVWVNPLIETCSDPETGDSYRGESVRLNLISRNHAVFNRDHITSLTSLLKRHGDLYNDKSEHWEECTRTGTFENSEEEGLDFAKREFFQDGDEYRWAFVDTWQQGQTLEPVKISAVYGYTPWLFFGVQEKFENELKRLEDEMHKEIEKYIGPAEEEEAPLTADKSSRRIGEKKDITRNIRFPNYNELFAHHYQLDMAVAVKERVEQRWMRAIILDIYEDESTEDRLPLFEVLFVDYGDIVKDVNLKQLFPIPTKFVKRMPFQVIAFRLDHVKPLSSTVPTEGEDNEVKTWKKEANDAFLDLILPDLCSELLDVIALERLEADEVLMENGPHVPCKYYKAVAIHADGDDLGQLLVNKGHASFKDGKQEEVTEIKNKLLERYDSIVRSQLSIKDEYDDDSEEHQFDFGSYNLQDVGAINEEDFDINVSGMESFMPNWIKNVMKDRESRPSKENKVGKMIEMRPTTSQKDLLQQPSTSTISMKPNMVDGVQLLHPQIAWRQSKTDLVLTILLPDIRKFDFTILPDKKTVKFRTGGMTQDYGFIIKLFGKLSSYKTHLTGQSLRVTLKKFMEHTWPRVLYDKSEKNMRLKKDLSSIDDGFIMKSTSGVTRDAFLDDLDDDVSEGEGKGGNQDSDPEAMIDKLKQKFRDDSESSDEEIEELDGLRI